MQGRPDPRGPQRPRKDDNELRINEEITASRVRLVGENIQEQGIYSLTEAMKMADDLGLDLVEISAKADPPVCKIIDYQKYLYQQKKKAKEMKSNSAKIVIKEIRFGPNTDEHDFQFKTETCGRVPSGRLRKSRLRYFSRDVPLSIPIRERSFF